MPIPAINTPMPDPAHAPPGRDVEMPVPEKHFVLDAPMKAPFHGMGRVCFGMGCFWGAEKKFWEAEGVVTTAVGYLGGYTPNPTYQEVCTGMTGHNEVVLVVFDPKRTNYDKMLQIFWENHDPTQGMRQGNDVGTQYRSGIYAYSGYQKFRAEHSKLHFEPRLLDAGFHAITTEIMEAPKFYFAEDYHQQYLAKNPGGYCGLGGTGVSCQVGLGISDSE